MAQTRKSRLAWGYGNWAAGCGELVVASLMGGIGHGTNLSEHTRPGTMPTDLTPYLVAVVSRNVGAKAIAGLAGRFRALSAFHRLAGVSQSIYPRLHT
jgi:hypothetical protein